MESKRPIGNYAFKVGASVFNKGGAKEWWIHARFVGEDGQLRYVIQPSDDPEIYVVRLERELRDFVVHVEVGQTPKSKGFFPPEGGFLKEHWYIANVAYGMSNPVHEVLLYAGLCDDGDLKPGNYSYLTGLHYRLDDSEAAISRPVYLRVAKDLGILGTERN